MEKIQDQMRLDMEAKQEQCNKMSDNIEQHKSSIETYQASTDNKLEEIKKQEKKLKNKTEDIKKQVD
jgi:hypothetical protein